MFEVRLKITGLKKDIEKTIVDTSGIRAIDSLYSWLRWDCKDVIGEVFAKNLPANFITMTARQKARAMCQAIDDNDYTHTTISFRKID